MIQKLFKNREDAFCKLCDILPLEKMKEDNWIVLATSAGGVPIAYNLAKKIDAQFDFFFTYKVFTPKNDECEIAIISETEEIVIHEELLKSFNIQLEDIYAKAKEKYNGVLQDYIRKYRSGKSVVSMQGKNVLLVDEGLNTGLTMMACIKSVIGQKAKSISVATPVLPEVTIADIESIADDLYYLQAPPHFVSIDTYYEKLENIDLEIIQQIIKVKNVNNM